MSEHSERAEWLRLIGAACLLFWALVALAVRSLP